MLLVSRIDRRIRFSKNFWPTPLRGTPPQTRRTRVEISEFEALWKRICDIFVSTVRNMLLVDSGPQLNGRSSGTLQRCISARFRPVLAGFLEKLHFSHENFCTKSVRKKVTCPEQPSYYIRLIEFSIAVPMVSTASKFEVEATVLLGPEAARKCPKTRFSLISPARMVESGQSTYHSTRLD